MINEAGRMKLGMILVEVAHASGLRRSQTAAGLRDFMPRRKRRRSRYLAKPVMIRQFVSRQIADSGFSNIRESFFEFFYSRIDNIRLNFTLGIPEMLPVEKF
jgi:hypothetical protein